MAVRVFIKRHFKQGQAGQALRMLSEFRKAAMSRPGYVSGETLVNHYDNQTVVVVSTWASVDDWIRWQNSEDRDRKEALIEELLDQPTVYEVFDFQSHTS
jgi:heme-degrading monooxygenase HmoA